ncbi:MAG: virulence protein SciE type [Hellea sp.]|nr:virulence protein SciE type [Hellea sp.]
MSNADELLKSGDIAGARSALMDQVRSDPSNQTVRMFLFQIFALLGEWTRAKAQLETMAKLDPATRMLAVAYSQCIDAEITRGEVFAGTNEVSLLTNVSWGADLATGIRLRQSGAKGSDELLSKAFDAAPTSAGTTDDGMAFDWVADADPRFGPTIEVIISGKYGLMPYDSLESLTIIEPRDLRDTIWVQAEFVLKQGGKIAGFIPVRYPDSEKHEDSAIIRGVATHWAEKDGQEYGLGQRLIIFSNGNEAPLLHVKKLNFEDAE